MSDEMLPAEVFTRRQHEWVAQLPIKQLLTDEDNLTPTQIKEKGNQIAAICANCTQFENEEIITNLEQVDDLDELNSILDDLYDYCNAVRIWVK